MLVESQANKMLVTADNFLHLCQSYLILKK